jgi:hypothetical protein
MGRAATGQRGCASVPCRAVPCLAAPGELEAEAECGVEVISGLLHPLSQHRLGNQLTLATTIKQ